METTIGERHSGVWGISRQTLAISFMVLLPSFTMAMTDPSRDFTCCTLLTIFSYRESLGAIITVQHFRINQCDWHVFNLRS